MKDYRRSTSGVRGQLVPTETSKGGDPSEVFASLVLGVPTRWEMDTETGGGSCVRPLTDCLLGLGTWEGETLVGPVPGWNVPEHDVTPLHEFRTPTVQGHKCLEEEEEHRPPC